MDLQRAGRPRRCENKLHNPQGRPTGAPRRRMVAPGGAGGAPVGFGARFRIALAGRALRIHAPGLGVGFAFGVDFGDPLS